MPKMPNLPKPSIQNPASRMAFSVAICAFAAAGLGVIVNHWITGWMAVGGMAGVGLFYLAIGVVNMGRCESDGEGDDSLNISQRHAGAENLYGEPVSPPPFSIVPRSDAEQDSSENH